MRREQVPGKEGEFMRRWQPWQYLIGIFVIFWIIFAVVLFLGDIPLFVISIALTTIAALSFLVVLLAWAYQNNL
jgi:flagellar biosynthesis component FlhA